MNWFSRAARQHPVVGYVVLTLCWSFLCWGLILTITPAGTLLVPPMKPAAFVFMLLGVVGPTFAAIVMTRILYGKGSVRALYSRLGMWRIGMWGLVILVPLLINLAPLTAYGLLSGTGAVDFAARLPMGLMFGITASIFEEFGWRGFMLPHLQKRFSPFVSALIVGLIWGGVWHGFADYIGVPQEGVTKLTLIILLGPVLLTGYSVILTALYNGTKGSMLACVLFHFFISFSSLVFEVPASNETEHLTWVVVGVGLTWLIAIGVALRSGMFGKAHMTQAQTASV